MCMMERVLRRPAVRRMRLTMIMVAVATMITAIRTVRSINRSPRMDLDTSARTTTTARCVDRWGNYLCQSRCLTCIFLSSWPALPAITTFAPRMLSPSARTARVLLPW
jgi:hypothetical protein